MFSIPITVPFHDSEGVYAIDVTIDIDKILTVKPLLDNPVNFGVECNQHHDPVPLTELLLVDGRKLPVCEAPAIIHRYLDAFNQIEQCYTRPSGPDPVSLSKGAVVVPLFPQGSFMRFIGGIDPGLTGALAILDFHDFKLHLWDTPTVTVRVGDKDRKRCDPDAFVAALSHFPIDYATIEAVQSLPSDGHVGAFTFGKVTGITIGICAGLDIPLASVQPSKWKHSMLVPANKKAAKHRASELFPGCTAGWSREMDHGRAEAAIISLYTSIINDMAPTQPFTLGLINGQPAKTKASK